MSIYRNRVEYLKSVEIHCYSLCVHLLIEETIAIHAAKAVLMDLYCDEQFWELEGNARDIHVRRTAIAHSIQALGEWRATSEMQAFPKGEAIS